MKTHLLVIGFLWFLPTLARADTLAERIVQFCRENNGKQVGAGNCYALAAKALNAAGAKPRFQFPDNPGMEDYVWGTLLLYQEATKTGLKRTGKTKDIQPGDVIQFRDTKWEGKRPGGKGGQYSLTFGHHTAIVFAVENGGNVLRIYQQNFGGKMFVTEGSLTLDDLKAGWIRVYRPVPKK